MILKYKVTILLSLLFCCKWILAAGGEIDERCKIECACCKNENCGPDGFFPEGNCYDGCIDGYRGVRCYDKCTFNCPKCDKYANICESCYDGFYLEDTKDCSGVCPSKCVSCTSSIVCTKCKDEFYNDHGSTDCRYRKCPVNCKCEQNICVECQAGYFGPSTTCVETCPSNCNTCQSKDLCQSCKAGYYNGKQLDNPQNPVMYNCVHQCRAECTSCLTFNNCTSCVTGAFGPTCQQQCSTGCEKNVCNIENGNCICKQNFEGVNCTKCIPGRYGDSCEKTCPLYCKNEICDQRSGKCNECIRETITGRFCDTCKDGWYGDTCNLSCPTYCRDNTCERYIGSCYDCTNNFDGIRCEECVFGKYGKKCDLVCPNNCADGICNQGSGYCLSCMNNYYGNECTICKEGFYGVKCDQNCSSNCLYGVCNRLDGECLYGCKANFSGDKCCVNSENCLICDTNTECRQCKVGFYNEICNDECPLNCVKDSEKCDKKTGHCLSGCIAGYFGGDCKASCSRLCTDNVCDQNTGRCSKGCDSLSREIVCLPYTENQTQTENNNNNNNNNPTAVIVMGVIIAVLVISLAVSMIFLWRARFSQNNTGGKTISTENNIQEGSDGHTTSQKNPVYYNVMETDSDSQIAKETENNEYEKITSLHGSEHEYGHITVGV
ncbi:multiple epidermal growth factor-like domains protein 10 [Ruditapes philippinarum]|uniref:multiple epidermal growth factor-like domains protein 10 n=1 Tax=Ruditapes philippinarum TaxID=129788 RepID=UPI00295A9BB7|nr:multiple epidermal growth factor-like domains protein 10 [Ruditapes philippinarum]